jgi:mono/diheme cytochrome c family protein
MGFRNLLFRHWAIMLAAIFILIQVVPYGRDHENPSITLEPKWDTEQTRALAERTCFSCHSNETHWPWYSQVAPVSWLVQSDVRSGRRHLNFSEWNKPQRHAKDSAEQIRKGEMPPWYFLPLHPEAKLTGDEKDALKRGLTNSLGPFPQN